MRERLRPRWALILRGLREKPARTPRGRHLITDEEMAQLTQDSWGLSDDLARHSLLPCLPGPAREGWRPWSADRGFPPPAW
jgi:hypothetical protein